VKNDEKSIARQAKEQTQRAARYEKLVRNDRGPHPSGASYAEKGRDARYAASIFTYVARKMSGD
jgi:hypothetical protein